MFYELLAEATIRSHISWAATSRVISSDSVLYKSTTYAHIHIHTYVHMRQQSQSYATMYLDALIKQ